MIPCAISCPECHVRIFGTWNRIGDQRLEISQAEEHPESQEFPRYYADFSILYPHRKVTAFTSVEDLVKGGFSPFQGLARLMSGESDFDKLSKRVYSFIRYRDNRWLQVQALEDLYFAGKFDHMNRLSHEMGFPYEIVNEVDGLIVLHQATVCGFINILPVEVKELNEYTTLILSLDPQAVSRMVEDLGGRDFMDSTLRRVMRLYSKWVDCFEKFCPTVVVSIIDAQEKFDKEAYGISTASFDDIKSFYADSYELIQDMVPVAVGLNNVLSRGDCNKFHDSDVTDFKKQVSEAAFMMNCMNSDEPFSMNLDLHKHIRNSIAHYNYRFDESTQEIHFIDSHRGRCNAETAYLFDLALLCYENMGILLRLNEMLYSMQIADYRDSGLKFTSCKDFMDE